MHQRSEEFLQAGTINNSMNLK